MAAVKGKGLMEQVCAPTIRIAAKPFLMHFFVYNHTYCSLFSFSQDLTTLDVNKLTPLSPEVISRQATINIGKF